jgi:hypothetical protein
MLFECVFGRLPQGIEPLEFPLGRVFGRCYTAAARRFQDGEALAEAFAEPQAAGAGPPAARDPQGERKLDLGGASPTWRPPRRLAPAPRRRGRKLFAAVFFIGFGSPVLAGLFGFATVESGRGFGRFRRATAVFDEAPPPTTAFLADLEEGMRRAAAALARIGPRGPTTLQWSESSTVTREIGRASRDYRLVPDLREAAIHAYPRHPGWPAFVCDSKGLFRKE